MNSGTASINAVCTATTLALNVYAGVGCAPGTLVTNQSNVLPLGCSPYNFTYGPGGVTRLLGQLTSCYGTAATASPTASLSIGASPSRTPASGAGARGAAGWVAVTAAVLVAAAFVAL